MPTPQEIATAGVAAQADLDKNLTASMKAAKDLTQVTVNGIQQGMVASLYGKLLYAKCEELEGVIAKARRLAAELHIEQTKVCKQNGVDTGGPLATVGGVTVGKAVVTPQPDGGGGR